MLLSAAHLVLGVTGFSLNFRPNWMTVILLGALMEMGMTRLGQEALQLLRTQDVDLVVTDCKMPNMSGLELIEAAREDDPELKFIADEADFNHLCPKGVMSKPFRLTELRDAVSGTLD